MVICLNCRAFIPFEKGYGALGNTHLSFRFEGYPVNSYYKSKARIYAQEQAFEVCCKKCFGKGKYFEKLIELYPTHLKSASRSYEDQKEVNRLKQQVRELKKELGRYKTDLSQSKNKLTSVSKQVQRQKQMEKERRQTQRLSKQKIIQQRKQSKLHTIFAFQSDTNKKLLANFTRGIAHMAAKFAQGNHSFNELFNRTQQKILQTLLFDYMHQIITFSRSELTNFNSMAVSISQDISKIKEVRERCISQMQSIFSKPEISKVSGIFDLQIQEKVSKISQSDSYMKGCEKVVADLEILVKNRGLFPINSMASNRLTQSSFVHQPANYIQAESTQKRENQSMRNIFNQSYSNIKSFSSQNISPPHPFSSSVAGTSTQASPFLFTTTNNATMISQPNNSVPSARMSAYDLFRRPNTNGTFLMPNDLHKS